MKEKVDQLVNHLTVSDMTGLSRSAIWRKVAQGDFPVPVRLGKRFTRWSLAEVVEWVESQKNRRTATSERQSTGGAE